MKRLGEKRKKPGGVALGLFCSLVWRVISAFLNQLPEAGSKHRHTDEQSNTDSNQRAEFYAYKTELRKLNPSPKRVIYPDGKPLLLATLANSYLDGFGNSASRFLLYF